MALALPTGVYQSAIHTWGWGQNPCPLWQGADVTRVPAVWFSETIWGDLLVSPCAPTTLGKNRRARGQQGAGKALAAAQTSQKQEALVPSASIPSPTPPPLCHLPSLHPQKLPNSPLTTSAPSPR